MRYAVLSDIHGNWEALETAVDYCLKAKTESYLVLGDTIGYGANPNECLSWAVENAQVNILGNHEKVMADPELLDWFSDLARVAAVWTRKVLKLELVQEIRKMAYVYIGPSFSLAHGSLHNPEEFYYLHSFHDAVPTFQKMETPVCLIGHTHVPCWFCERERSARLLGPGIRQLKASERYILNPGSVGQPRDADPRLSFGIFDEETLTFEIVRLAYDNEKAARKIRQAGLPDFLADRLL